jgi:hypothetical protein
MQLVIPKAETAYVFLARPQRPIEEGKEPQYSCTFVYDKADKRLAKLKAAIEEVAAAKFGAKAKQMLEKGQLRSPLRDGDDSTNDDFAGKLFITCRSTDKPEVVDADAEPVFSSTDIYSGMVARADVYLFSYDKAGNKGVGVILNSVQKLADGDRKSGRRTASEAFGDLDDEDAALL